MPRPEVRLIEGIKDDGPAPEILRRQMIEGHGVMILEEAIVPEEDGDTSEDEAVDDAFPSGGIARRLNAKRRICIGEPGVGHAVWIHFERRKGDVVAVV